jgi:hypothetical protein
MQKPWRIWLAFALAPPAAWVVASVVFAAFVEGHLTWMAVGWNMKVMLIVAGAATVVLAIPTYLVLRRRSRIRLYHCILAGLIIGLLGGATVGGAVGLLAGFLFWLIGIWRNDDVEGIRASAA